jgi:hypothetical protein
MTLCNSAALNSYVFMQDAAGPLAVAVAVLMGLPAWICQLGRRGKSSAIWGKPAIKPL